MDPVTIGIIGCGNISEAYFKGAARSELLKVKACADLRPEAAAGRAAEFGVEAVPIDALLADPEIEFVINLTVPVAHAPVSLEIVDAGKHVYSEKPLAVRFSEGQALLAGRGRPRTCASAALPTPSSAPPTRPAAARSTRAGSAGRWPGPLPSCRTAWSTGTRARSSSSSAAAARSTTSAPTTSPSSSTCWARWRG